jgi:hypothetical protein
LALVLTPLAARGWRASSVSAGMRPSGGSTTSQARLYLRSNVSKMMRGRSRRRELGALDALHEGSRS